MIWVVLAVVVVGILGTVVIARGRMAGRKAPALAQTEIASRVASVPAARNIGGGRTPTPPSPRQPTRSATPAAHTPAIPRGGSGSHGTGEADGSGGGR